MIEPCCHSCGQCVECLVWDLYRCRAPYFFCMNRCGCCVQCIYAQRMSCIVPSYQIVTRSCPWYADPFSPVELVCLPSVTPAAPPTSAEAGITPTAAPPPVPPPQPIVIDVSTLEEKEARRKRELVAAALATKPASIKRFSQHAKATRPHPAAPKSAAAAATAVVS